MSRESYDPFLHLSRGALMINQNGNLTFQSTLNSKSSTFIISLMRTIHKWYCNSSSFPRTFVMSNENCVILVKYMFLLSFAYFEHRMIMAIIIIFFFDTSDHQFPNMVKCIHGEIKPHGADCQNNELKSSDKKSMYHGS